MKGPLSVAMIVKDEAALLSECLESVRAIAGEICVVDTGSRDGTLDIARKFGAKTGAFAWCNDFAAARNASLGLCTGDWILVIDADERLTPLDCTKIQSSTAGPRDCCYRIMTRNYTNEVSVSEFHACVHGEPAARGFAGWFPSWKIRLFPNHAGACYRGKVHELVRHSLEEKGIRVLSSDAVIHHYPLLRDPERLREKQRRYLELGQEKLRGCPSDANAHAELGRQYAEMGDYGHAAGAYREAVRIEPENAEYLKELGSVLYLAGRADAARQALRLALDRAPDLIEAWRNLGVIHAGKEEWEGAAACFSKALALDAGWGDGYRYLSVALDGLGQLREAADAAWRAVAANPRCEQAVALYVAQMLRLDLRGEARRRIENLARSAGNAPPLARAIETLADSGEPR